MRTAIAVVLAAGLAGLLGWQQEPPTSDEGFRHPPVLPPGHPPLSPDATPQGRPAAAEDVASIDALLAAYYDSISGPVDAARDWDRFLSLFAPEARLVATRPGDDGAPPVVLTPEQFVQLNGKYFEAGGYVEREIHHRRDAFGRIAQVFSTYESRQGRADALPYSRGINSFQLVRSGGRWWIVTILWDRERPGHDIPPEYLPGESP